MSTFVRRFGESYEVRVSVHIYFDYPLGQAFRLLRATSMVIVAVLEPLANDFEAMFAFSLRWIGEANLNVGEWLRNFCVQSELMYYATVRISSYQDLYRWTT